jgi:hypothetical protein
MVAGSLPKFVPHALISFGADAGRVLIEALRRRVSAHTDVHAADITAPV